MGSVLKPPFLCKCCSAIRHEEVCKQVGCERERLTLYINNTNFPLINMQQLKHIIFQDLLNEPRIFFLYQGNTNPLNWCCDFWKVNVPIRVLRGKVFGTPTPECPLSFAPTWTGPKNSEFMVPTPDWPDYILPGPERTETI